MIHEPALRHPCPLCCLPPMPRDGTFLRRCKRGVLQFVILKPVTAALSAVMLSAGLYVAVAVLLLLLLLYCRRHGSARHSLHLLPRYRSPGYQNFLLVAYVCRRPAAAAAAASTTNCLSVASAVFALPSLLRTHPFSPAPCSLSRRSSALTPSPGTTHRTLSRCTSCSSSTSAPRRCSPAGPRWPSSRPSSSWSSPRTWRLRCCCCYYCYCYCYYYYAQGLRLLCPPRLHYYYHYYCCCCCYY